MLLRTKLFRPPMPRGAVVRKRLTRLFERTPPGTVALVVAGAGYGKSTAVAQWLDAQAQASTNTAREGWLSLDERDNDPSTFWRYLTAAALGVTDDFHDAIGMQRGRGNAFKPDAAAEALIAALSRSNEDRPRGLHVATGAGGGNDEGAVDEGAEGAAPAALTLVIDDYHHIKDSRIHESVTRFANFLPEPVRLVLISRSVPPLPLSRWRVADRLLEIGPQHLALRPGEVELVAASLPNLGISKHETHALHARTEGWPVGVKLALLAMQGADDPQEELARLTGQGRPIAEYVLSEVLGTRSLDVQRFLLDTAILPRLCAPLCREVTQSPHADQLLQEMVREGLPIISLNSEGTWFRYQDLFREYLLQRALSENLAHVRACRERAAAWLEAEHAYEDALEQLLPLGHFKRAGQLILTCATERFRYGDQSDLSRWLSALPQEVVHGSPALLSIAAWTLPDCERGALAPGLIERAEKLLANAEAADGTRNPIGPAHRAMSLHSPDAKNQLRSEFAMMRSFLAMMSNDFERSTSLCHEAIGLARRGGGGLPLRGRAYCGIGHAHFMRGEMAPASDCFDVAMREALLDREVPSLLIALGNYVHCEWQRSRFDSAVRTCRRIGNRLTELGLARSPVALWQRGALFPIFLERWQRDEAWEVLAPLIQMQSDLPLNRIVVQQRLANYLRAIGDYAGAMRELEQLDAYVTDASVAFNFGISSAGAQMALTEIDLGCPERALPWLQRSRAHIRALPETFITEGERLINAIVEVHAGDVEYGIAAAGRIRHACVSGERHLRATACDVIQAVGYHRLGQSRLAKTLFATALQATAPVAAVRTILDPCSRLAGEMISQASAAGATSTWAASLLTRCRPDDRGKKFISERLAEPLSQRELQALTLIAQGLRNADIARELNIRESTVKVHMRNLYAKLGVRRRTEAIVKAREIGLVA